MCDVEADNRQNQKMKKQNGESKAINSFRISQIFSSFAGQLIRYDTHLVVQHIKSNMIVVRQHTIAVTVTKIQCLQKLCVY